MKSIQTLLVLLISIVLLSSCGDIGYKSTDQIQKRQTEQMMAEAQQRLGMPNINNYTERRMFKEILERRDNVFTTYSYIMDMNGDLHLLCESMGYGIPFSTQYTNPEKRIYQGTSATLPQPDPNGLFMPSGSSATYVMCGNEDDLTPVYVEQELLVSPFKIDRETW